MTLKSNIMDFKFRSSVTMVLIIFLLLFWRNLFICDHCKTINKHQKNTYMNLLYSFLCYLKEALLNLEMTRGINSIKRMKWCMINSQNGWHILQVNRMSLLLPGALCSRWRGDWWRPSLFWREWVRGKLVQDIESRFQAFRTSTLKLCSVVIWGPGVVLHTFIKNLWYKVLIRYSWISQNTF